MSDEMEDSFSVAGTVTLADGSPPNKVSVSAVDRSVDGEADLGRATTDPAGHYEISFTRAQLTARDKAAADLVVTVRGQDERVLATSPLLPAAPMNARIDLRIDASLSQSSEYDRLMAKIVPRLRGTHLADLTAAQTAYLAQVTGETETTIGVLVSSGRLARAMADTAAGKLPAQVFYALVRTMVRTSESVDALALMRQTRGRLIADLEGAEAANIVSALDAAMVEELSQALTSAKLSHGARTSKLLSTAPKLPELAADLIARSRIQRELAASTEPGHLTVHDLFAPPRNRRRNSADDFAFSLDSKKRRVVAELVATDVGAKKRDFSALASHGFDQVEQVHVERVFAIADLTRHHKPMVQALGARLGANALSGVQPLAGLAQLTGEDWRVLVEAHGAPADINGDTPETRHQAYATELELGVEKACRTAVLAARIQQARVAMPEPVKEDIGRFFSANPEFEFGKDWVLAAVREGGRARLEGVADASALKRQLMALDRTYKLTDDHRQQGALLSSGLDSAQKIARLGRRELTRRLASYPEVEETAAAAIHARAEQANVLATTLLLAHGQSDVELPAMRRLDLATAAAAATPNSLLKQVPDLATLFGSMDSCAVDPCRSVLSPAAYFVDLMKFLADRAIPMTVVIPRLNDKPYTVPLGETMAGVYVLGTYSIPLATNCEIVIAADDVVTGTQVVMSGGRFSGTVQVAVGRHRLQIVLRSLAAIGRVLSTLERTVDVVAVQGNAIRIMHRAYGSGVVIPWQQSVVELQVDGVYNLASQVACEIVLEVDRAIVAVAQQDQGRKSFSGLVPLRAGTHTLGAKLRSPPGANGSVLASYSVDLIVDAELTVNHPEASLVVQLPYGSPTISVQVDGEYSLPSQSSIDISVSVDGGAQIQMDLDGFSYSGTVNLPLGSHVLRITKTVDRQVIQSIDRDVEVEAADPPPVTERDSILDILLERRPDLAEIELSCSNSDTLIPYVDLVLEVLESHAGSQTPRVIELPAGTLAGVLRALNEGRVAPELAERITSHYPPVSTDSPVTVSAQGSNWAIRERARRLDLAVRGGILHLDRCTLQTPAPSSKDDPPPQQFNVEAYEALKAAIYPIGLPFDLWNQDARIHLDQMGVPIERLLQVFYTGPGWEQPELGGPGVRHWRSAAQRWGLSELELSIIAGTRRGAPGVPEDQQGPWNFWGWRVAPADWPAALTNIDTLLKRSRLQFDELQRLMDMRFVNFDAEGKAITRIELGTKVLDAQHSALDCDLTKARLVTAGSAKPEDLAGVLSRTNRFLRLWRKLGWPMSDIDRALTLSMSGTGPEGVHAVFGLVVDSQGRPLNNVRVHAVDQDVAGENDLGSQDTGADGRYRIEFKESLFRRSAAEVGGPDVVVRLKDGQGRALGQSLRHRNAAPNLNIDLRVDPAVPSVTEEHAGVGASPSAGQNLISAIDWTYTYLRDRLKLAQGFQDTGHLDTTRYRDFAQPGWPLIDSPYEQAFLRPGLSSPPKALTLDASRREIQGFGQPSRNYVEHIASACGISVADAHLLIDSGAGVLSHRALSWMYFTARAAAGAGVSIWEFLELVKLGTATVPRQGLANEESVASDAALALASVGASASQAIHLLTHRSQRDDFSAQRQQIIALLTDIRAALATIIAAHEPDAGQIDPDGSILQQRLLQLNWNAGVVAEARAMLAQSGQIDANGQKLLRRHLASFSVIDRSAPLDPASVPVIPPDLKSRCYYAKKHLHFLGSMSETDIATLIALSANADYRAALVALRDAEIVIDAGDEFVDSNGVTILAGLDGGSARFAFLLPRIQARARRVESVDAVVTRLGGLLSTGPSTVQILVSKWLSTGAAGRDVEVKAIEDFLDNDFASSPVSLPVSEERFPAAYRTCVRLLKFRALTELLGLPEQSWKWLFAPAALGAGWLDPNNLPATQTQERSASISGLLRLVNLARLREFIPGSDTTLEGLFALSEDATALRAELVDGIATLTGWNRMDLETLLGPRGFDLRSAAALRLALQNEWVLLRLGECFVTLQRLGAQAAQCLRWCTRPIEPDDAAQIHLLARAGSTDAGWSHVAKRLRDALREQQRQALVALLNARLDLANSTELYDRYLIDVEMSPATMTSRLKQAAASVQLFVQRCLLNLEPEVAPDVVDTDVWVWMKNYRVWEANRKVFLYPENWIEPDLRDDQSEPYRQLNSDLLQSSVNDQSGLNAFKSYVRKLQNISRITVISSVDDLQYDGTRVTHVVGRDGGTPHRYYYRQWLIPPMADAGYWTAWEEVSTSIDSEHVLLFMRFGSACLAWATVTLGSEPEQLGVALRYTVRTQSGWAPPISSDRNLWWLPPPNIDESRGLQFEVLPSNSGDSIEVLCRGAVFPERILPIDFALDIQSPYDSEHPAQSGRVSVRSLARYKDRYGRTFHWLASDTRIVGNILGLRLDSNPPGLPIVVTSETGPWFGQACSPPASRRMLLISLAIKLPLAAAYKATSVLAQSAQVSEANKFEWYGDFILGVTDPTTINYVDLSIERNLDYAQLGKFSLAADGALRTIESSSAAAPLQTPIMDVQPHNSNYREIVRANDRDFMTIDTLTLLLSTPGRFSIHGRWSSAMRIALLAYTDDRSDLFFWSPAARRAPYRMWPLSFWWASELGTLLERSRLMEAIAVQRAVEPPRQQIDVGPGVDPVHSALTTEVRFDAELPLSVYSWETFFHVPLLVATHLMQNQRFEEAQRWLHLVFDPTAGDPGTDARRFWRFKPFREEAAGLPIEQELLALSTGTGSVHDQVAKLIAAWKTHPFQPHLVARGRHRAYQLFVLTRYLDNLIAWGDYLFRQDTIESINEATLLYSLASEILGRRPARITAAQTPEVKTYSTLGALDEFSNALEAIETLLPPSTSVGSGGGSAAGLTPGITSLYFGVPANAKLLGYWDTVEDRLYKIRLSQNIEGIGRQLPLQAPPIDPALLVRAVAAGVDISSALADLQTPLPHYRFSVTVQKASELAAEVRAFGGLLLAATEKQDAEGLSLLRSTQELSLLRLIEGVRTQQAAEARANLAALRQTRELVAQRYAQYQKLLGKPGVEVPAEGSTANPELTPLKAVKTSEAAGGDSGGLALAQSEADHLGWMNVANNYSIASGSFHTAAGIAHFFPNITVSSGIFSSQHGGMNVGSALDAVGAALGTLSGNASFQGNRASTIGGHQRRYDDWAFQSNLAAKEIEQIDKQILASELRASIAERELANHRKQMENAESSDAFMRDKFSNAQLCRWMVGRAAGLHFLAYQLAFDLAKRAERSFTHELGLDDSSTKFIQFGSWDGLRKGLMAGESLSLDIKRLETAYFERNRRELEIAKHVSLRRLDPEALVELRVTGRCEFDIPEWLFDLDAPGLYMRRLKSVAVSIPCITGPYTGVFCKLTLLKSRVRKKPDANGYALPAPAGDPRFTDYMGAVESVMISGGGNDSGLFETNLRDDRYLPFEGSGAISTWRLELAEPLLAQFDYSTISDVIMHLRYTARDGRDALRMAAFEAVKAARTKPGSLLVAVRHDFPGEWARAVGSPDQDLTLTLTPNFLPYVLAGVEKRLSVSRFNAMPAGAEESNRPNLKGFETIPQDTGEVPLYNPIQLGSLRAMLAATGNFEPTLLIKLAI